MIEQNRSAAEFWQRYCTFDVSELEIAAEPRPAIAEVRDTALALIDRKARTPLEPVAPDSVFLQASAVYQLVRNSMSRTNAAIRQINELIAAKKDLLKRPT